MKEKHKTKLIFILSGIILLIIILFLILLFVPSNFKFNFYINETGEHLDGKVYFQDISSKELTYLGFTKNGKFKYDSYDLYPGKIIFEGEIEEIPFNFTYDLSREDLGFKGIDYIVTEEDIKGLNFQINSQDIKQIKDEIFNLINYERRNNDIIELHKDLRLEEIAQDYADRMLNEDFYAHTDPQGKDVYNRLQKEEILYWTATENLDIESVYPDTNLSEEVVYGWIESPGHRIPVLDTDVVWDNIGIGLSCDKLRGEEYYTCYAVAVFAGLESLYINEELENDYIQSISLYSEDFGIEYDAEASIVYSSSSYSKLIITSDPRDFDRYVDRNDMEGEDIWTYSSVKDFDKTITIKPGYTLLIHANSGRDIVYNLSIKYNP